MSIQHVRKWVHDFLNGCEEHDLVRVEQPSTARTSDAIIGIRSLLEDDCWSTARVPNE